MPPTDAPGSAATSPPATNELLTGEEFLTSLDDGRAVYFDGERAWTEWPRNSGRRSTGLTLESRVTT